jgi:hypothetical protein
LPITVTQVSTSKPCKHKNIRMQKPHAPLVES